MSSKKKNIVVIGGGNGSSITVNALKQNLDKFDISAVVSMSDSGGSSGRLRKEFNTVPPGDIMRAVLAMSKHDFSILKQIFNRNRFSQADKLDGHNLGNLFLVWAEKYAGDFMSGVWGLEQVVEAVGKVYPATLDKTDLVVELDNGKIVRTEAEIDRPKYDRSLKIKKAWLEPAGSIYPEAKEILSKSDYIIFCPGSLYTSVIAAILPQGMFEAITKSKAKLIYIAGGGYATNGETGPVKVSEFIEVLESYLPRKLDLVVLNNHRLMQEDKKRYTEKQWGKTVDDLPVKGDKKVLRADFEKKGGGLCSIKLGRVLKKIIK